MRRLAGVLVAALLVAAVLGGAASRARAARVSCAVVIKEIDEVIGKRGKYRPDPARIARKLGVEPAWVVRCAGVYGRQLSKHVTGGEDNEEREERWETDEPEEQTHEDAEDIPPTPEPERRRVERLPPTPSLGDGYKDGYTETPY